MLLSSLLVYATLNFFIALLLHIHTSRRTLQRPQVMELVMYFLVMLLIGTPLFLLSRIFRGAGGQIHLHRS